jgi:hypothetical protein
MFAAATVLLSGCNSAAPESGATEGAAASAANVTPLVSNNLDCSDTSVFRFDAVSPGGTDNRRIFIDFENASSGVVTRGSLATHSHFGGYVYDCSTAEVRCLEATQLVFAWPKDEAQTTFNIGKGQCQIIRAGAVSEVSCFIGQELRYRYRVTGNAIDRVELFYPDDPVEVFEPVDDPLPICKL